MRLHAALCLSCLCALTGEGVARAEAQASADPRAAALAQRAEWVKQHAIEFGSCEAGHGFEDLEPLKNIIGDARIVALGEATHGTREFFQMKHRLVEFLASEMGFTIFSIEASTPESYAVNPYVLGEDNQSDPKALIAGMYFWTWNTEEVLAMVEWMRAFNRAEREAGSGRRIEFTGFDMQTPDVASAIVRAAVEEVDKDLAELVADAYDRIEKFDPHRQKAAAKGGFATVTGTFPVEAAAGRRIVFRGWIRTENVEGWAGLWWRADQPEGRNAAFDNMFDRGPRATTDWKQYELALDIPADTTNINFGMLHSGTGTAWFDGLEVEIDGRKFDGDGRFDFELDGQAVPPAGFAGHWAGYDLASVEESRSGARCLKLSFAGEEPQAEEITGADAARLAGEVLEAMERAKQRCEEALGAQRASWMIHNARIVHQCCQMFAGEKERDLSMATNVKWILDSAPAGTRIVLWAHNGHVQKTPPLGKRETGGGGSMGGWLDEWYGDDYVVIGFTAAEGTYTAIGKNGLGTHELKPPEKLSAEEIFKATGLPRFILDTRLGSKDNPASEWLTRSVKFRMIGALAQDWQFGPVNLGRLYDAVIYFEHTEASRPLK